MSKLARPSELVIRLAVLSLLLAAVVAACGGDDGTSGGAATTTEAATTEQSGGAMVVVGGRVILGGAGGLQSPLDGVTVTFTPADAGSAARAETDGLGRYSIELPPGDYDVELSGLAERQTAEPLEVSIPADESFQLPVIRVTPDG